MRRLAARLGFVHRRLWRRDGTYRAAILLGPPPLIGVALAAAVWAGVHGAGPATETARPPWAHPDPPTVAPPSVLAANPTAPLPAASADGGLVGWQSGWVGKLVPIEAGPAGDVNVLNTSLGLFTLDRPDIDLARVLSAGPPTGLHVGLTATSLVVRDAGRYALTARLERDSPLLAECLLRLGFGGRRLISSVTLGVAGHARLDYPAVDYALTPGLYRVVLVSGCWHGQQMLGPGWVTLLVRHPGETVPVPARPDEVVRPNGTLP